MTYKRRIRPHILLALLGMVLTACAPVISEEQNISAEQGVEDVVADEVISEESLEPTQPPNISVDEDPFANVSIRFNPGYWPETDFTIHSVDYGEILSGGPPPDGIPAIDRPVFEAILEADEWLGEDWPVMIFENQGDVRAYPLAILIHHEIVNDVVGDEPVAITFCPLCNATIAFKSTLDDGRVLDFGTTGNLRNSDLVMYDRQTKSWWQQFTGEGIVGEMTGTQLEFLPSQIIAWSDFKAGHPDGKVLSRETGFVRNYGRNPYAGYDSINSSPYFPVSGDDGRLRPMERVVAIQLEGMDIAYPFSVLEEVRVVNDVIGDHSVVVFWKPGTSSTFGNSGQETGSTGTFFRVVDDQVFSFEATEDGFKDIETGSFWTILGLATEGPLAGTQLSKVISGEHFWFAWATFKPDTEVWSNLT